MRRRRRLATSNAPPTANIDTPTAESIFALEPVYAGEATESPATVATSAFTAAGATEGCVTTAARTCGFSGVTGATVVTVVTVVGAAGATAAGMGAGSTTICGTTTGWTLAGGYCCAIAEAPPRTLRVMAHERGPAMRRALRVSERAVISEIVLVSNAARQSVCPLSTLESKK